MVSFLYKIFSAEGKIAHLDEYVGIASGFEHCQDIFQKAGAVPDSKLDENHVARKAYVMKRAKEKMETIDPQRAKEVTYNY